MPLVPPVSAEELVTADDGESFWGQLKKLAEVTSFRFMLDDFCFNSKTYIQDWGNDSVHWSVSYSGPHGTIRRDSIEDGTQVCGWQTDDLGLGDVDTNCSLYCLYNQLRIHLLVGVPSVEIPELHVYEGGEVEIDRGDPRFRTLTRQVAKSLQAHKDKNTLLLLTYLPIVADLDWKAGHYVNRESLSGKLKTFIGPRSPWPDSVKAYQRLWKRILIAMQEKFVSGKL